ncbi:EAL domain-containing protein [Paenibacillus sp. sptzw28]|uniref:EAL domain-containing protein n=1 Tax=Paenibacillus sp. sptzw28 TaxID=715179 RepID=UPI001C6DFE92|nr:EAL domain-containing protein [Paenibacillus sp. sptzw28]QYR23284.1 EAL domain-containing protein [Paenibacillus sp. sptzw28]
MNVKRYTGIAAADYTNSLCGNESGPTGIIYLAWHGKAKEREEIRKLIRTDWRRFAEQAIADQSSAGMKGLTGMWMQEDLYVCLPMPHVPAELLEEILFELGSRFKREWERRFIHSVLGGEIAELKLHAGVSFLNGGEPEESRWYEGVKRALIHGQAASATERSLQRLAFGQLIQGRTISSVYQPIVSLKCGKVYGYEALSRFLDKRWFDGPQELFAFAAEEGMTYALDRLARERAIEGSMGLGSNQKLFINITAHIMNDPSFTPGQTLLLLERFGLAPHNVVFEITERSSFEDFGAAKMLLDHYRNQGYQIAIDDAGAGYSSLQSIVEIKPDFIKIDRSLIQDIHRDPMKQQIVQTFTEFAAKMDISLVAEGIEEEEELHHVKAMGVGFAQGYLLGRPQPVIG